MNSVVLVGRLVRDPSLKHVPASGLAVTKFTIAVDKGLFGDKKKEYEAQGKPTADFIKIVTMGKQAENCSVFLGKGSLVAVNGSISTGSYKDDKGVTQYTTEIMASRVEFLDTKKAKGDGPAKEDDFSFGGADFNNYQEIEDDDDVPF